MTPSRFNNLPYQLTALRNMLQSLSPVYYKDVIQEQSCRRRVQVKGWGSPGGSAGKESACNAGDLGSIPGLGRSPGGGKSYPLQCSGLENFMDRIAHGVTKSQTRLSNIHFHGSRGAKAEIQGASCLFRAHILTQHISVFISPETQ